MGAEKDGEQKGAGVTVELSQVVKGDSQMKCFRCGICCMGPRVALARSEAARIAGSMGLTWPEWCDRYAQWQWTRGETCYIRQVGGACAFLERDGDSRIAVCAIHDFKPKACVRWTASLYRRQCQEGLERFWGIAVGPWALTGSRERLREFRLLLQSLDC